MTPETKVRSAAAMAESSTRNVSSVLRMWEKEVRTAIWKLPKLASFFFISGSAFVLLLFPTTGH